MLYCSHVRWILERLNMLFIGRLAIRYLGGKTQIGKQIASVINKLDFQTYWEPFAGMFGVGRHVRDFRIATDAQADLIYLLQAIQKGFKPPTHVSEATYNDLKKLPPSAVRGFVGFGCSFAGKFFGGYARDKAGRNYAESAARSLEKLRPHIQNVVFGHAKYNEANLYADIIYCDPPYANTTKYSVDFNSADFWNWARQMSKKSIVLISEYTAPADFKCIWSKKVNTDLRGKEGSETRVEKLFTHERCKNV